MSHFYEGELKGLMEDHYLKKGIKSINLPADMLYNNLYCQAFVDGLISNSEIKHPWTNIEGKSAFCSEELRDLFIEGMDLFFFNKWRVVNGSVKEPEVEGKLGDFAIEDFSLVTENLAVKSLMNVRPAVPTFYIASEESYPLQFSMKSSDLSFDLEENLSFKIKDYIWFCIRPGGFILSLEEEDLKFLEVIMKDVGKGKGDSVKERANNLFRPSSQENMYKAWGTYFMFLKETGKLHTAYFRI